MHMAGFCGQSKNTRQPFSLIFIIERSLQEFSCTVILLHLRKESVYASVLLNGGAVSLKLELLYLVSQAEFFCNLGKHPRNALALGSRTVMLCGPKAISQDYVFQMKTSARCKFTARGLLCKYEKLLL